MPRTLVEIFGELANREFDIITKEIINDFIEEHNKAGSIEIQDKIEKKLKRFLEVINQFCLVKT